MPAIVSRLPPVDFSRPPINAVTVDHRTRFGISATLGVVFLVVPNSSIVISRSNLQDRPHENHEKYRHAFARGVLDHRWPFRIRVESGPSHLPTLSCSPCRRHLYSHWQMRKECRVTSGEG